jgi:DNA-binding Xre family transcriptional regulator
MIIVERLNLGISYKPLFVLMAQKGLKKMDLLKLANISRGTLAKFAKGEPVGLEIIDKLCKSLDCQPNDIFEVT